MANRSFRPTTMFGTAAVLIAGAGLTACGSSSHPGSTAATNTPQTTAATSAAHAPSSGGGRTVSVKLSEYKIISATASAPAGRVVFDVTNTGKIKHQFTIIRTTKPAGTVLSKQNPNDDIAGARGEIASIAAGATKKLVIKSLKAGHYAFVCALPGHYQSGMHADFTVN